MWKGDGKGGRKRDGDRRGREREKQGVGVKEEVTVEIGMKLGETWRLQQSPLLLGKLNAFSYKGLAYNDLDLLPSNVQYYITKT